MGGHMGYFVNPWRISKSQELFWNPGGSCDFRYKLYSEQSSLSYFLKILGLIWDSVEIKPPSTRHLICIEKQLFTISGFTCKKGGFWKSMFTMYFLFFISAQIFHVILLGFSKFPPGFKNTPQAILPNQRFCEIWL